MNIKIDIHFFCRVFLAVIFVVSAFLKLISLDSLSIYLYSFKLFSFDISEIFARLLVGFEFCLGFFLVLFKNKIIIDRCVFCVLSLFSLFLIYLLAVGNEDNCHCFGEMVEFSPLESLIKNIILFILLFFASKSDTLLLKKQNIYILLLSVFFIVFPFAFNLPNVMSGEKNADFNAEKLDEYLTKINLQHEFYKGKKIICFFSTSCKHCQYAARKLEIVKNKFNISNDDILYCFYAPKKSIENFIKKDEISVDHFVKIDNSIFQITKGILPLIIVMEDGKIVEKMNNSTFSEEYFKMFK